MAWLGTWAKRKKITVSNTNIDADLTHFPVPIVLGASVGRSNQDLTDIFDDLATTVTGDAFTGTDGDAPNPDLWFLNYDFWSGDNISLTEPEIFSNRLKLSSTTTSKRASAFSFFKLSGDFDIQVDFELSSGDEIDLYVVPDHRETTDLAIVRAISTSLSANTVTGGTWTGWASVSRSNNTGTFRFQRTGTSLVAQVKDGAGSWQTLYTRTWQDADVQVFLQSVFNSGSTGYFDNFVINSGTVKWPENTHPNKKKIAITKSDGETQIYGELEHWDSENEKAVIWVSKSDLVVSGSADTDLYIYYDPDQDKNHGFIGETAEYETVSNITGDDFTGTDGDALNVDLWRVLDGGAYASIQNNKLNHNSNQSTDQFSAFDSVFSISGDFDVQIDFDITTMAWPSSSVQYLGVALKDASGSVRRLNRIHSSGSGHGYNTADPAAGWAGWYGDTTVAGKIRFTRVGSVIKGFVWENSQWEYNGSTAGFTFQSSADDMIFELYIKQEASAALNVNLDNFTINSGTVKYPTASRVWDDDFAAVYHMAQDPSGGADCILDSTVNSNALTSHGTMTSSDLISADAGKGLDFDGTDDYLEKLSIANNPAAAGTIEMSYKPDGGYSGGSDEILFELTETGAGVPRSVLYLNDDNSIRSLFQDPSGEGNIICTTPGPISEQFYYQVGSWGGVETALFLDGVSKDTDVTFDLPTTCDDIRIAAQETVSVVDFFHGIISETRMSHIARSATWIKASYHAIADNLLTFGSTEVDGSTGMDDMALDIAAFLQAKQDMQLDISAFYQSLSAVPLDVLVWEDKTEDHPLDVSAAHQDLEPLPFDIQIAKMMFGDAPLDIATTDGIVTRNVGMDISLGDGYDRSDVGMDLMIAAAPPAFKAIYAMHLNSVIKEI